jgi:hypothetical protein
MHRNKKRETNQAKADLWANSWHRFIRKLPRDRLLRCRHHACPVDFLQLVKQAPRPELHNHRLERGLLCLCKGELRRHRRKICLHQVRLSGH